LKNAFCSPIFFPPHPPHHWPFLFIPSVPPLFCLVIGFSFFLTAAKGFPFFHRGVDKPFSSLFWRIPPLTPSAILPFSSRDYTSPPFFFPREDCAFSSLCFSSSFSYLPTFVWFPFAGPSPQFLFPQKLHFSLSRWYSSRLFSFSFYSGLFRTCFFYLCN